MASEGGRSDTPLARLLFDDSFRFEFFQAVRLLERIYPKRTPVGRNGVQPAREVVRFRTRATLQFPPSEIFQIDRNGADEENGAPPDMFVSFMGLTGPLGVLPTHYTELVMERARFKDTALWSFLDLFNHRMISLFYRAWEKYRFPVAYERGEDDRFTEYLFDIIGMGTPGLRGRLGLEDQGLLLYGGLITQKPRSASAIASILGDYFAAPARVCQFTGQWLNISDDSLTRLGQANSQLGISTIVGTRVWDTQSKFRLRFGPLSLKKFTDLLPVAAGYRIATSLARFLVGMEFDFDLQPVLRAKEVPGCILTTRARRRPMLGWTTWLKTRPFTEDDAQVVLRA